MIVIGQIVFSIILIVLILLQERSSGLSSLFGGQGGTPYQTRRGIEKFIFIGTIIAAIIYAGLALANLII